MKNMKKYIKKEKKKTIFFFLSLFQLKNKYFSFHNTRFPLFSPPFFHLFIVFTPQPTFTIFLLTPRTIIFCIPSAHLHFFSAHTPYYYFMQPISPPLFLFSHPLFLSHTTTLQNKSTHTFFSFSSLLCCIYLYGEPFCLSFVTYFGPTI